MSRKHAVVAAVFALGLCHAAPAASADPIGDFFKRVGRTLSKPVAPSPRQNARKSSSTRAKAKPSPVAASPAQTNDQPPLEPTVSATPTPSTSVPALPTVRAASVAPESSDRGDLPYAVPVANRPGFVTSPYAPTRGFVDVRNFPSGTEVKDPYTGKIFRTP